MGKTRYYVASSLDGFIADETNSLDWLYQAGSAGSERFATFFAGVGAFAMGATTYEWVIDHENLLSSPDRWHDWYGDTPGWVFTHRELPKLAGVDLRFVSGDVRPVHAAMMEAANGKNLWLVGGGELVGCFADQGLLDEILVGIAPATLGRGSPLLPRRLDPSRLRLSEVEQAGQLVYLRYDVAA